jgi:hypothetical protein
MANEEVTLVKKVYGTSEYEKAINPAFTEFVTASVEIDTVGISVSEFFDYYQQLFFDIPVEGVTNSHTYLVQQSQQYIGGSVIDLEKQALVEEINSLRQQLLDLNQNFTSINNLL